jgi:ABC-2 type transport system ATP-binding protein
MIDIRNLSKRFGKTVAVNNLSLTIPNGQILGLVGPNGSGKTTTIKSSLCLIDWDTGEVKINGHDIIDDPVEARKGLGYIPDIPEMFGALTVWQHISFIARAHRAANWERKAEDLLKKFELTDKRNELVSTLSKGQKQKCWCICLFATDPMVMLMDEPVTGLDPRGIHVFKDCITDLKSRGGCGLISSHQLHLVEQLCDRIALISDGKIVIEGSIDELKEKAKLAKGSDLEDLYLKITDIYCAPK